MSRESLADPESFVHRVRKKYDVGNKDEVDDLLKQDKKEMNEDDFQEYGNPPGIYWYNRDIKERNKEAERKEQNVEEQ